MALEDLTGANKFIDDFVTTNPVGSTDAKSTLDDHIRGIKNVLQNQFPTLTAAVTADAAELNKLDGLLTSAVELGYVAGVSSAIQTQLNNLSSGKAPLAGPSFTGTVIINDSLRLLGDYEEQSVSLGTSGSLTCDLEAGTYFYTGALIGTPTFTFSNPAASGRVSAFTLELNNAGGFAPVWPAAVVWANNDVEPVWTTGIDIVSFLTRDNGATWRGVLVGLDF